MLVPNRLVFPSLAVVFLSLVTGRCEAQSYRNAEKHFSIELPKGWQVLPKTELDQINRLIGGRMFSVPVHYEAGLRRQSGRLGSFPYVLIQTVKGPPSGASFEELERALAVDMSAPLKEAQGKISDIIREMKVGQPVLDRKSKRVIMHTQSTLNGVGTAKGLSIGHLGKDNIVFIHCYQKAEDFENSLPTFMHINDWFSFDNGYDFKPGTGSVSLFSWWKVGRGGLIGGFIGLVVGLGGYLFRLMSQTGTTKARSIEDDIAEFDRQFKDGAK